MTEKEIVNWFRDNTESMPAEKGFDTFLHRQTRLKIKFVGKTYKIYLKKQNIFNTTSNKKLIRFFEVGFVDGKLTIAATAL